MLLGLLIGGPPSIEPDFDAETGLALDLPDTRVAVICYAPTDVKLYNPNIDHELSQIVAGQLCPQRDHGDSSRRGQCLA